MEGHKQTGNVKLQAGLEEDSSSDSSCMVVLKLPSVRQNVPATNERSNSRVHRKRTYKKVAYDDDVTSKRFKRKRSRRTDSEALSLALTKAKELQRNLSSEHPSFIKQIQRSHVTKEFQLGIPADFRRLHLPARNEDVVLEDEIGEHYMVKFSTSSEGKLIGGWKRFSVAHNLLEGDVLVFHLLGPCHFKVYIVRANDPTVVERANLKNEGKKKIKCEASDRDTVQETGRRSPLLPDSDLGPESSQSATDGLFSSDTEASPIPIRDTDFENFKIVVNGVIIDDELSKNTRLKYYKLCCSRGSYLHKNLLKNVDPMLASGIITGTMKVIDAVSSCEIDTSKDDFTMWDDMLEGFMRLGMDVGFVRDRLKRLAAVASELRGKEEVKKYEEAKNKRDRMIEEMRSYERKVLELKKATEKVEDEMKKMKVNIQKHRDALQEEANAPW